MKLVSFWIEDYMNLRNLGFNLGHQHFFEYSFDANLKKVTVAIEKTKDYFNLFSSSKIKNISGIIGNNGAGKTSVLKFLNIVESKKQISGAVLLIFYNEIENKYLIYNYTSLFKSDDKKTVVEFIPSKDKAKDKSVVEILEGENPFKTSDILFYSNLYSDHNDKYLKAENELNRSVDYQSRQSLNLENIQRYVSDYSFNNKSDSKRINFNVYKLYFNERFRRLLRFLSIVNTSHRSLKQIISAIPFPEKLTINFRENLINDVSSFVNKSSTKFEGLTSLIKYVIPILTAEKDVARRFENELIFKFFLNNFNIDSANQFGSDTFLKSLNKFIYDLPGDERVFENLLDFMLSNSSSKAYTGINQIRVIYDKLRHRQYNLNFSEDRYANTLYFYEIEVTEHIWEFIRDINAVFDSDDSPLISFRWHPLSAGQEAILNQFSEIWIGLNNVTKSHLIVSIDEGELYLHPEWQRQYVGLLYEFLNYFLNLKANIQSSQIIITSHSPFIATDIPKFSLIFLQKEDANETNARPSTQVINSQNHFPTFGGNIFDLYKNSFFIKDFYGVFSTRWINEAFKKVNNEQSTFKSEKELREFIEIIGENVIKDVLGSSLTADGNDDGYEIIDLSESANKKLGYKTKPRKKKLAKKTTKIKRK